MYTCGACGGIIEELGEMAVSSGGCVCYQKKAEESANSLQQLKVEICPYCNGTGLGGRNEKGFKLDCWYCHGIGQTTTV
jgi:hypothetical protein